MKQLQWLDDGLHKMFLDYLHRIYTERLSFYGIQNSDLNRFSWSENKKVLICGIKVYADIATQGEPSGFLVFAVPTNTLNKVLFLNLFNETKNPSFSRHYNEQEMLNWIIDSGLISKSTAKNIVPGSLKMIFSVFDDIKINYKDEPNFVSNLTEDWIRSWVDKEYNSTLAAESTPTLVNYFPSTFKRYFIDKYHFEDMLKEINNDQFTDEFNQCLFAYEHEKWFLCASGLGSCLEHLMYIILNNYAKKGYNILNRFPKDPTAKDYVNRFRQKPIGIDSRQARAINLFFMARNSVDHYNSGKTQRIFCDLLLDGISDVYNDYFGASMNAPLAPTQK